MPRLTQTKVKEADKGFLSVIFDQGAAKKELEKEERSKIELFEKGLENSIQKSDTIEDTVDKIVSMALAAEFGPGLLAQSGAKAMVSTISRGILSNSELRRSALIIADRFASTSSGKGKSLKGKKDIPLRGRRKAILNG